MRLDYSKAAPGSVQAMYKLQKFAEDSGLERPLLELVRTRVSQINGCAFCIDMHTRDARAAGESEQRLYGLSAWREAPYYSARERAALGWAEVVTLISETHASDEEYEAASAHFSAEELVKLTMAVIVINGWNRLAIAFRQEVGKLPAGGEQISRSGS
jgi:AhpD family alkylhydroperoxidase